MTAIVGVLCCDGPVMGTDSSTTFTSTAGQRTIEQPTEKLKIYSDSVILAGTGQVGLGQRFGHIVETAYSERLFVGTQQHINVGKELCKRGIQDFAFTNATRGQYGALLGFSLGANPYLCEFAVDDFQPEFKTQTIWYCSMGSGQPITDPLPRANA